MILQGETEKRKYNRPTYETRVELINMVQRQGQTIKNSAKILNIKQSTAKLIVSRYRTCGTIHEGINKNLKRKNNSKVQKTTRSIKSQQTGNMNNEQKKDHRVEVENQHIKNEYSECLLLAQIQCPFYYDFMPVVYYPLQIHQN